MWQAGELVEQTSHSQSAVVSRFSRFIHNTQYTPVDMQETVRNEQRLSKLDDSSLLGRKLGLEVHVTC